MEKVFLALLYICPRYYSAAVSCTHPGKCWIFHHLSDWCSADVWKSGNESRCKMQFLPWFYRHGLCQINSDEPTVPYPELWWWRLGMQMLLNVKGRLSYCLLVNLHALLLLLAILEPVPGYFYRCVCAGYRLFYSLSGFVHLLYLSQLLWSWGRKAIDSTGEYDWTDENILKSWNDV